MLYNTGDHPEYGTYKCTVCGEIIVIDATHPTLPVCPVCGATTYTKVAD